MTANNLGFIPSIDTIAGACLTMANWQDLGLTCLSHSLENLLAKPGLDVLLSINNLGKFLGWPGKIVLNAMNLKAKAEVYTLKSPYDGSAIIIPTATVLQLIKQLQPDYVLLPQECRWEDRDWSASIGACQLFFQASSQQSPQAGVYFINTFDLTLLNDYQDCPRYVAGDVSRETLKTLVAANIEYVESNQIAMDAYSGLVYTKTATLNLADSQMAKKNELIDPNCSCPTCRQQFTCAYLHHLLEHTPLLAQRLVISHNVHRALG